MSKLTRITNGKVSNKAINVIANTAGMIATAIAVSTAVAVFAPSANAYSVECRNRMFGGGQDCSSSTGGSWRTQPRAFGGTDIYGRTGGGRSFNTTCSTSAFGVTRCD